MKTRCWQSAGSSDWPPWPLASELLLLAADKFTRDFARCECGTSRRGPNTPDPGPRGGYSPRPVGARSDPTRVVDARPLRRSGRVSGPGGGVHRDAARVGDIADPAPPHGDAPPCPGPIHSTDRVPGP